MRKHNEGYILVYVMVVLLVFCLVATSILTSAMRNLQNQQVVNEQMKAQYDAQGKIEMVLAQWGTYKSSFEKGTDVGTTGVKCIDKDDTTVTLYAESGAVSVTCKMQLTDGKYIEYDVGTVATEPSVPASSVTGGEQQ